ncbi:MAG: hypothetical protein QHJ73_17475, partial [Armatimonadota bacterium]|nr:hypothetical protein [Armatimonadota bacterium]
PSVIEQIAVQYNGRVLRAKSDPADLMALAVNQRDTLGLIGSTDGRFIFPWFHPAFDAMMAAAKLIDYLGSPNGRRLSELVAAVPPYHLREAEVECAWEKKGEVMRRLTEEAAKERADFTEGVKIFFEGGWVLVTPDPRGPAFHIYVEASESERAEAMVSQTRERILAMAG